MSVLHLTCIPIMPDIDFPRRRGILETCTIGVMSDQYNCRYTTTVRTWY